MSDQSVNAWLRKETPKHTALLTTLRERLELSLTTRTDEDADGKPLVIPADVNDCGTPTRDWCRAYQRYSSGYTALLQEERERAKLQLMARMRGGSTLTDDEFESEIKQLAIESLRELSTEELATEFLRRGMSLPVGEIGD